MSRHVLLVVHQFFPSFGYGTEKYTLDLAQALSAMGWQVTVLTATTAADNKPLTNAERGWYEYVYDGVRVVALDLTQTASFRFEQSYRRSSFNHIYRELLLSLKPDIIHCCHLLNHTTGFLRVAKFFKVPIVYTLTDFWMICWTGQLITNRDQRLCGGPDKGMRNCMVDFYSHQEKPSRSVIFNKILNKTRGSIWFGRLLSGLIYLPKSWRQKIMPGFDDIRYRNARIHSDLKCVDRFVVASNFMLDAFVKAGYDRAQFAHIPFGVPRPSQEEQQLLNARYDESRSTNSTLRIGFIGQVMQQKGVDLLVKAFIKSKISNAELHIYGDLNAHKAFSEELKMLSADNTAIISQGTFRHDQIYKVLSSIDLLVIPSTWHENSPLVLLNGLVSRTPVVISDAKGMVEFVEQGKSGYVFPIGNVDALSEQLAKIASDRKAFFNAAKTHPGYPVVKESYAQKISMLYQELLGSDSQNLSSDRANSVAI